MGLKLAAYRKFGGFGRLLIIVFVSVCVAVLVVIYQMIAMSINSAPFQAAARGDLSYFDNHIENIDKFGSQQLFGPAERRTLLMIAVSNGHLQLARRLIKLGADVNITDEFGRSAIMFACESGRDEMVYMLIDAGANINQVDRNGDTALTSAILGRHSSTAHFLIENGASPVDTDDQEDPAILAAVTTGNTEVLRTLLSYGWKVRNRVALIMISEKYYGTVKSQEVAALLRDRSPD